MTLLIIDRNRLHQRTMRTIFEDIEDKDEDHELFHSSFSSTDTSTRRHFWILVLLFVIICYLASAGEKLAHGNPLGLNIKTKESATNLTSNKDLIEGLKAPVTASRQVGNGKDEVLFDGRFPTKFRRTGYSVDNSVQVGTALFPFEADPSSIQRISKSSYKQTLFPTAVWDDSYRSLDDLNPHSLPVFFQMSKEEGSTIRDIITYCHAKAMAFDMSGLEAENPIMGLHLIQGQRTDGSLDGGGEIALYANVDLTTEYGIQRASAMGLVESGLAEIIVTPLLYDSAILFAGDNGGDSVGNGNDRIKGKIFAVFQHPVRRAIEQFKSIVPSVEMEQQDGKTLEDYASALEENIMVRTLARVPASKLIQQEDLELAMAVVSQKILVGLHERIDESMARFEQYFGWRYSLHPQRQETCRNTLLSKKKSFYSEEQIENEQRMSNPFLSTRSYQLLHERNEMDLLLYIHVRGLFHDQGSLVEHVDANIRLINATCSICVTSSNA